MTLVWVGGERDPTLGDGVMKKRRAGKRPTNGIALRVFITAKGTELHGEVSRQRRCSASQTRESPLVGRAIQKCESSECVCGSDIEVVDSVLALVQVDKSPG